ncbi:Rieske (2Fe-2S) protein, partial [Streptomyces sp. 8L]|uniref:Rieske (2Fe-2S) protein n=1 Tax=Streptomyces sp. 8L TaxID=2877242 RepID=UPI001CD19639
MTSTQGAARIVTRRTVVATAGAAGLGVALAACGGGSDSAAGSDTAGSSTKAPAGGAEGGVLAKTSDIPEGGGKIFTDQKVVVTQPKANEFKAFSAVCTHQGCTVASISDGTIKCPCHGSTYSIVDGSVKG